VVDDNQLDRDSPAFSASAIIASTFTLMPDSDRPDWSSIKSGSRLISLVAASSAIEIGRLALYDVGIGDDDAPIVGEV
jgi:hypothetical protein